MKAWDWIKTNRMKLAKWGGLGFACLLVGIGAFVGARYAAAGSTYDGELLDIAPANVAVVITIDDVPARKAEIERFLDDLVVQPRLPQLERSSLWRDSLGKPVGGSLERLRTEKLQGGLQRVERVADDIGATLFEDALYGELVVCTDPARAEGDGGEFVMLSRVSRNIRFKWQFMDFAPMLIPDGPNQPRMDYRDGVLRITPRPTPDNQDPDTFRVAVLDDVLVVSNSDRLFNASVANHAGGADSVSNADRFNDTLQLVDAEQRARHAAGVWIDLDRMRDRLPAKETDDGGQVSPVDTFNGLPDSVVGVYPDILEPVSRILRMNLDTRPFGAAWYGIDLSNPDEMGFDQYLLVNSTRGAQDRYAYLRKTWNQPAARQTQLSFLPDATIMQVSYRQPMDLLYREVFDEKGRESLVGDFVEAVQRPSVLEQMDGQASELMFAMVPREFAPEASIPISGTDLPLPGFAIGFRTQEAEPNVAQALLQEYLYAQRGVQPGDKPKDGPVQVVRRDVGRHVAFGFHDPRKREDGRENFIYQLNRSIRAALIGDWLLLTNSHVLLERAFEAQENGSPTLEGARGSVWGSLPTTGNATAYLNFEGLVDYAKSPELFKVLRDSKYNPTLIEGRDPGELRREIAANMGLDPTVTENLLNPDVVEEYNRRKTEWEQTCEVEGRRYVSELQSDLNGLRFFRDLALITTFKSNHLHVQGILRIGD